MMSCVGYPPRDFRLVDNSKAWNKWRSSIMGEPWVDFPVPRPPNASEVAEAEVPEGYWVAETEISDFYKSQEKLRSSPILSILEKPEFKAWQRICRDPDQAALHQNNTAPAKYQTLFQTNRTNSLGIAPPSIREGDQIALIAGLEVPMVIRALDNGHYKIIPPTTICGMMEGQAWGDNWEISDNLLLHDLTFE